MRRKRKDTLSYEAAQPDGSPRTTCEVLLGSMWEKESFQRLAGQADARIEAVKNPALEFRQYMEEKVAPRLRGPVDPDEALKILQDACDFLAEAVFDERRISFFAADAAAADREAVREERMRLFQDMVYGLDNFAVIYEVTKEFEVWKIQRHYDFVPGKRADVGANSNAVRIKTIPGPPSEVKSPEIPKAAGVPFMQREGKPPKKTTLPMMTFRRPSETTHEAFDPSDMGSEHPVQAARIRTASFVGRLFEIGEDMEASAAPSSSPRNETAPEITKETAFKNFRRTFLPLFPETIALKLSEPHSNFSQALHSIVTRTCVHLNDVSGGTAPFLQYAERNASEHGSLHALGYEFACRVLEEQAKKVRPAYIQHVHSYLQERIDIQKIVPLTADELDREAAQAVKQTFHILHKSFAKGDAQLGPFIWLYYYFLEENQDEAHAFYNELYDTVFGLYEYKRYEYKRDHAEEVPVQERVTYPEPAAATAVRVAREVGTSGIYGVASSESVPGESTPPIEEEPVPYSTTSDLPPGSIPPEPLPSPVSLKGGTLPPPKFEKLALKPEPTPEIEILGEEDFVDDEPTLEIQLPGSRAETVQIQPLLQPPAPLPKPEPQESIIINMKNAEPSQRDIPTAPPSRLPSMPVMPKIPQAPHLPLFEEKDPSLNEPTERKARPKQSRWGRWVALGAAAVTALGAYVSFRADSSSTDTTESQNSHQTAPTHTVKTTPAPTPAPSPAPQTPKTTEKNVDSPEKTAVILASANYDLGSAESTVSYAGSADAFEGGSDATPFMSKVHSAEWNEKQQNNAEVLLKLYDEGKFDGASAAFIKKHEQILRDLAAQTDFDPWKFRLGFEKRHAGPDFQSPELYGSNGVYNLLLSFERIFKFSGNNVGKLMKNIEWLKLTVGEKMNDRTSRYARALEFKQQSQDMQNVPGTTPGGADSDDQKGKTGHLNQQIQPDNDSSYGGAPEIEYTEIDVDLNDLLGDDTPEIEYAEIDVDPNELLEDDTPEIEVMELTDDDIEIVDEKLGWSSNVDISTPEVEVREVEVDRAEMISILNEEEMAEIDAGWDEIPAPRKEEKPRGLDTSFMKNASVASYEVDTFYIDEGWDTLALAEDKIAQRLEEVVRRAA